MATATVCDQCGRVIDGYPRFRARFKGILKYDYCSLKCLGLAYPEVD